MPGGALGRQATVMTTILDITPDDILKLDDVLLRELVARLCEAEVVRAGYAASAVTWGGDQRAADGGIDVRVALQQTATIAGFIPRAQTGFQVKAEDYAASKIKREMRPSGKLRGSISQLAHDSGAYIIVSSRGSVSDTALARRKTAMAANAKGKSKTRTLHVDFYDRRRIASWVEQHPSIAAWVRQRAGRPMSGWRPYESWAYSESDVTTEYVLDEQVKIFTPGSDAGSDVRVAINRLRGELATPQTSVRLVGLSGVGKTRLVQALFDGRLATENATLDRSKVLYADMGDEVSPVPQALVDSLLDRGDRCLIVVDNCGADLHQRLTEKVKQSRSQLTLATIEYDIRDDVPEGSSCYRLEPSSDELIQKIVKRRHPALTSQDVETIAQFSGGNARVAFALASTSIRGGELAKLEDGALFRRLFEQSNASDSALLTAAEVCSLLYSFHGEHLDDDNAEIAVLARLVQQSPEQLYRHVNELRRRGLVQSRGPWRAVLPHAIANRLAQRALQNNTTAAVLAALTQSDNDRLARSFSRRLGYLHDDPIARSIVAQWLSPGGILSDVARLNDLQRDMLINVAPVDPRAALEVVHRACGDAAFGSIDTTERARLSRLVRSIAYEPEYFEPAMECLLAIGELKTSGYTQAPSRELITSLFQIHLSGTNSPIEMRAEVVRSLLVDERDTRREIGIAALDAAFEATHFSSTSGFEFGARKRSYGWYPRTRADIEAWFSAFIDLAIEFGGGTDQRAKTLRQVLGKNLRGLWTNGHMFSKLEAAANVFLQNGGWAEGWRGTKSTIAYDKKSMSESDFARLQELEKRLRPTDLLSSVRSQVLGNGVYDLDDTDEEAAGSEIETYERNQKRARELGRKVAGDALVLGEVIAEVSRQTEGRLWEFGLGLGEAANDPRSVLKKFRDVLAATPAAQRSITAILGFLNAAAKKHADVVETFQEESLRDEIFAPYFPFLQCNAGLNEAGVARLLRSIQIGNVPAGCYGALAGGRATDALSVSQVASLVTAVRRMKNGQSTALNIIGMVVFCVREKSGAYKQELRSFCVEFLTDIDWEAVEGNTEYHAEQVLKFALPASAHKDDVQRVVESMLSTRNARQYRRAGRGTFLLPLLQEHTAAILDAVFKPDEDGRFRSAVQQLSGGWSDRGSALDSAPTGLVIAWCNMDPGVRFPFIAACCRAFKSDDEAKLEWSTLAVQLLRHTPATAGVLSELVQRITPMSWSGSRAMIIRKRAELLDELPSLTGTVTTGMIAPIKQRLLEIAEREARQEREEDRARDERFE